MHESGDQIDCSIIISTHNRQELLSGVLGDLEAQHAAGLRLEAIIVDNASTDGTRELLQAAVERVPWLQYVHEPVRGPASGRNAGVSRARGRIIAFTDDDNRISSDWASQLVRALDDNPDIDVVAGRILPNWLAQAPEWLTQDHWVGPLALQDYGEDRFVIDASHPIALSTANLAIRRSVLERLGGFSRRLLRAEDTELLVRFWRAGGKCLYVPEATVAAEIRPERMTKRYHAWWHNANGAWTAAFDLAELIHHDGSLRPARDDTVRLGGVPAFLFRELMSMSTLWAGARLRRAPRALVYEHRVRFLWGYICSRYRQHRVAEGPVQLGDLFGFARAMIRKKWRVFGRGPNLEEDWSSR
jgi:GT2 family glycosyltransferase